MFKNRNLTRIIVISTVLIALTAVTATAAIGIPGFSIFDSITTFFGGNAATTQNSAQTEAFVAPGTCETAGPIEVESSGGSAAGVPTAYATLSGAAGTGAMATINAGVVHTGTILVEVCGNTNEGTATIQIKAGSVAPANWSSMSIKPAGGAARTITGATTAGNALVFMDGVDNLLIDGLNTSGNSLTFSNTTASATANTSTFRFNDAATNNTITNTSILGSFSGGTAVAGGTIFFSTDGVASGNDGNIISNNNIGPAGANLPTTAIYGLGTTTTTATNNSGIQITDNKIFDFFGAAVADSGIFVSSGNTDWTISGNSLYQTATRTMTTAATDTGIQINNTSGNNFTISNNFIGGSTVNAGGTAWTIAGSIANRFRAISLNVGSTTPSSVQGNTIANFNFTSNSSATTLGGPWTGIYLGAGNANIGTTTGNTIGATTGTGSITISVLTNSGSISSGIFSDASPTTTSISNNNIGSISFGASTISQGFQGIAATTASSGAMTISGNTIGSATTANSININTGATSTTNQIFRGINNTISTVAVSITGNTIANVLNNYLPSSATSTNNILVGITSTAGINTITGNTVRNMTTSANHTGTGTAAPVIGILQTGSTAGQTVGQNTIHSLSETHATAAVNVYGIYLSNSSNSITNIIERNFIHSLSAVSSGAGIIRGIYTFNGGAYYRNNMIRLGIDSAGASLTSASIAIDGILSDTVTTASNTWYHNSIYIGGGGVSTGSAATACFKRTTSDIMDFRNNIAVNARSNGTGTGKHYIYNSTALTTMTADKNVLNSGGTGFVFGFDGTADRSTFALWQSNTSKDTNSVFSDPLFATPTGTSATVDLHIAAGSPARDIAFNAFVSTDIDGQTRPGGNATYDVGADEQDGTTPAANDIAATAFIDPTSGATKLTSGFAPQASFKNNGTAAQTNVPVRYRICADAGCTSVLYNQTTTIASLASGATATATFPSTGAIIAGTHSTKAKAELVGDTVTGNDEIGGTVVVKAPLSGTVAVCSSCTYTSITNAGGLFEAINALGLSADLTVEITGDISGELGTNALNTIASGKKVTMYPTGAARTITGSSANGLITLNGADDVIIDGSLGALGAGDRSLTITNTNSGTSSAVIWLQNGANSNRILNLNVVGNSNTTTLLGIGMGSSTISISSAATNISNRIESNSVSKTQYGIYSGGLSSVTKNTGNRINSNLLNTASPNNIGIGGIFANFEDGIKIAHNNIGSIDKTALTGTAFGIALGLVPSNTVTTFTGSDVINADVSGNIINGITQMNATGYSAFGIVLNTVTSGTSLISNNMISQVRSAATPSDFSAGIVAGGGVGSTTQIYANSVAMTGTRGAATNPSYALAVGDSNPTIDIRNNILLNTQTSSSTGKSFAIGRAYSTYTALTSDNNDLFTAAAATLGRTGGLGDTPGTDWTFATWQSTTGKDANSKNVDPQFKSTVDIATSDLHLKRTPLSPSPVENFGVSIAANTVDYDEDTRSLTPDIGADEVTTFQLSAATYTTAENVTPATVTVTRTGGSGNAGTVQYATSAAGGTTVGTCGSGGADYQEATGTLSFAAAESSKTFDIVICNDAVVETNEDVNITLSNATGSILGAQATAVLTITNDDVAPPSITLGQSSLTYGSTTVGTSAATQTSSVAGSDLTDVVQCNVSPTTDYSLSGDGTNFGSSASYVNNSGSASGTLTVKFTPTALGTRNATVTCASPGATSQTISLTGTGADATLATDYFRSLDSGNWDAPATWQSSHTGDFTDAITATLSPDSNANTITVRSPHTVTIPGTLTVTINETTIDSGAQVTVNDGGILALSTAVPTVSLVVNGTLLNQGKITRGSFGIWEVGATGTFIHNSVQTLFDLTTILSQASFDSASTMIYRGGGGINTQCVLSGKTYGNLKFESTSGAFNFVEGISVSPLTVSGTLSIGVAGGGTPTLQTGFPVNVTGDTTIGANGRWTMTNAGVPRIAALNGNFVMASGGQFSPNNNQVNVRGNWSNAGTFNAGTSTVAFNGDTGQTVTGDTTFYNFTKAVTAAQQMNFTAGSLTTVTNSLTLTGTAGNILSLRSTTDGTYWNIQVPTTRTVNYVNVKDSDNTTGVLVNPTNSVEAGHNVNWFPLVCPAGKYFNGSACVDADPGYYVPTFGQTSQTPCAAGTFQPDSGAISCNDATPGHFVSGTAQIAQTPCEPGKYQPGTAATSCIDADMGYFVGSAGQELQTKCAIGSYQPNTGQTSCFLASAGSYVPIAGSATQTPCAAGFFQPLEGASACNPAAAGTFISGTGSAVAGTPCAAGSYQPASGQASCTPASANFYVPSPGSTSQTPCAPGYTSGPGATVCTPIPTTVLSLTRSHPNPTNLNDVIWTIEFAALVDGVSTSNFALVNGGLTTPSITSVNPQGTAPNTKWNISVNTGGGSGTLGLNFVNATGLTPGVSTTLPVTGEVYTVDKDAPAIPSITGSTPPTPGNTTTPIIDGTAEAASTVKLYTSSDCTTGLLAAGTATGGNFAIGVTVPSNSTTNIYAAATDAAGNVSGCSTVFAYKNDINLPDTSLDLSGRPANPTTSTSATFTFSGTDSLARTEAQSPITFECALDGGSFAACTSPKNYPVLGLGSHTFQVRAKDPSGNVDPTPESYTWLIVDAPTVGDYGNTTVAFAGNTTVTPSAPPANATNLTVSAGTGYAGAFAGGLKINQVTGVVTVTDAHPAGTYTVTVNAFGPGSVATDTFVLTVSPGATCGQSSFDPAVNYAVGTNPNTVVTADVNLDGKPDMVVANGVSDNVSVLLGNGSGGFGAAANFAVGDHPNSIAVADFNLDGNPDIATANDVSSNITVLFGDGSGGVSSTTSFGAGNTPFGVVVADFNFDGKPDLAVANAVDDFVTVFIGNGIGGFAAGTTFAVGDNPIAASAGDFNNDGNADLVTANNGSNNVSVLIGNGVGGFAAAANFGVGTVPQSLAVDDLNHDGKADIVVTTTAVLGASVLLGDGIGGFAAATNTDVGTNPTGVAISDLNLDGNPDLVVTNFIASTPNVSVMLGDGTGAFGPQTIFGTGDNARSVAVGDFDLDGKPDLAVANFGSANVSVLLSDCVAPVVDIAVTKNDGGATVAPGGTVAYTLNYANNGTAYMTGVVLTETVPAHSTFNAGLSDPAWVCADVDAGSTCTLPIGSLASGAGSSAAFAVTVEEPISGGATQIDNTATIADDGTHGADVNLTNNTGSDSTPLNIPISFAINNVTANEGDAGQTAFTFTITKTGGNGQPTTVTFNTCDGTASAPDDFAAIGTCGGGPLRPALTVSVPDEVTFGPTDTTKQVTVYVNGDTTYETDETFSVVLASATNGGTFTDNEGLGTITNDDIACTPPSVTYVDDNWIGTTIGTDPDGGGPATQFGCDSFATVAGGISGVAAGGTVNVAAGTYTETGQIVISKDVALVGADRATTIIKPAGDTGNSGDLTGWFLIDATRTFNISGVTLDGTNRLVWHALRYHGSGTVNNVAFLNIKFEESGPAYRGGGVFTDLGVVNVTNSTFNGMGRFGVLAGSGSGNTATGTISGNTYTGKGAGNWLDYAFDIEYGANYTISGNTITGNLGVAMVDNSDSAAISVWGDPNSTANISGNTITGNTTGIAMVMVGEPASPTVTITGNNISGNANGLGTQDAFGPSSPNVTVTGSTITNNTVVGIVFAPGTGTANMSIHHNRITGNGDGVFMGATGPRPVLVESESNTRVRKEGDALTANETVNVQNNWWGCNEGPAPGNTNGCDEAVGLTAYTPWLVLGTSASPATVGVGGNSTITADMTKNSAAATPLGGPLPDIAVVSLWTATNGTMSPTSGTITAGTASSTFLSTSPVNGTGCANVDNEQTCANITMVLQPPTAAFTANPNPTACSQNVSFDGATSTAGPGRSIVSYSWDFGDTGTGAGISTSHAYSQYGPYSVVLTVTDDIGQTDTETVNVSVSLGNLPPVSAPGGPYLADLGSGFSLNGSGSSDPNAGCGDSIVSYAWSIDSGVILLTTATPSLSSAQINSLGIGIHSVALTVTDTFGNPNTASTTLSIYDNRPFAGFTASPNPSACSQVVSFDGSGSTHGRSVDRAIVAYNWDFGDGNFGTGVNATHAYAAYGNYTAKLTVTDNNVPAKTDFITHQVTVNQGNQPPVSVPGGPYSTIYGNGVVLNGSGSTDPNSGCGDSIFSYAWSIDAGAVTTTGVSPSLSWAQIAALGAGSHTVALTVTDTFGQTNTASTTLNIGVAPSFTISDVSLAEGDSGITNFVFTVTKTGSSGISATVEYNTVSGTATSPLDFAAISAMTLTFAPSTTTDTQQVTVQVNGDTTGEPDETFTVRLSNATNATIADADGLGTIVNDDCATPPANMIAWYGGEDNYNDIAGPTFETGAPSGTVGFTGGLVGRAFNFTGSGYAMATATSGPLNINGNQMTMDGWVRPTSVGDAVYFGRSVSFGNDYLLLNQNGNKLSAIIKTNGLEATVNAPSGPQVGVWTHIALTYDGSMMRLYMNGVEVGSTPKTGNITDSGQPFGIGGRSTGLRFNGAVDEVEVFNRALSSTEIATLAGVGSFGKCKAGLIQFSAPTYTVGENGVNANVVVKRTDGSKGAVSASFNTSNGTATTGTNDYTATSQTVSFADGNTTDQTIQIPINNDTIYELTETINVALTSPTGGAFVGPQGTTVVSITDNDVANAPTLSIDDPTLGGDNLAAAGFTVTLTGATEAYPVTVHYKSADGSATAGSDYTAVEGDLTFGIGETTKNIPISVLEDTTQELPETFVVNLTLPVNATISDSQGTATITSGDPAPSYSINDVSVVETNGGTTTATFTVTKTGATTLSSTVNFATQNGTATTADNDYVATSGNLTFPASLTTDTQTFTVTINGDTTLEPDETFNVLLTSVTNANISDGTGVGTILNDECTPMPPNMLSWYSGENNADDIVGINTGAWTGTPAYATGKVGQAFDFDGTKRVTASGTGSLNITGAQMTMDGWVYPRSNATAYYFGRTAPSDHPYVLLNIGGNLVVIIGTTTGPSNQQFDTGFAMPVNTWTHLAMTYDANGVGDKLRIYANGTQVFSTPTTGGNLRSSALPLTLGGRPAGDNSFNGLIDEVEVFDRALDAPAIAALASASGGGKCHTSTVQFSSNAYSVTEGNVNAPITVTRVGAHDTTATFNFATSAGTATAGATADYDAVSLTGVTFAIGEVSKVVNIPIHDDNIFEVAETVNLAVSNVATAPATTPGTPLSAVLTIDPDADAAPVLNIGDYTFTGANSLVGIGFPVSLTGASEVFPVTVHYQTSDNTAIAGSDYTATSGTLTFNSSGTTQFINVPILPDTVNEPEETFFMDLDTPVNATINDGHAIGTIPNDDPDPTFTIDNVSQVETDSGTTDFVFTVTKTGQTTQQFTVNYTTATTGSAIGGAACGAGIDYENQSGSLVFAPSDTTKTITIKVCGDTLLEPDETFGIELSGPPPVVFGSTPRGTILNDDCTPPPSGMVAWYQAENNANDIAGGYNGTLQNGTTFAAGKVGQAFSLDGTNDNVNIGDVDLPSTFSIDAWINPDTLSGVKFILSKDDGVARSYYVYVDASGSLYASVRNTGGQFTQYGTEAGVITTGSWQHIAVTYDGSGGADQKMKFYVNGVSAAAASAGGYDSGGTPENNAVSATIGSFGDGSSLFDGLIDEVEIFNRVLTPGEIANLATAGGAGKCQTPIVQFANSAEMEDESQTAAVKVNRTVSTSGPTTVTAATVPGGTATGGAACTAGVQYKTTSQLLSFGNGASEQTMSIEICPDLDFETPQTIKLQLSGPSGAAVLGGRSEIFLTINDTATQFTNHAPINIAGVGSTGSPYPSIINVSGAPTVNGGMRVTLYDVTLSNPDHLDVLLVGPLGQKMVIMGDAGGLTPMGSPVTLTFDDAAGQVLPNGGPLTTGKFEPTTWEPVIAAFPAPAPAFPYVVPGSALGGPPSLGSGFGAGNPNGQWRLFVRDDGGAPFAEAGQPGAIAGGWGLQFVVPTASGVSVSGRVTTAEGRGIRGAIVTVTGNSLATPINVMTGVNGRYIVEGLTAGETYVVTIRSRRFVFSNSSRIVTLNDNVSDADFVADPGTTRSDQ
ncbi:MAG: VCBS repeat-containing protein [Chloracidobacterium sp.]|nr:VCBS repeat-containing protein [Chloracidobacterium sp.]